MAARLLGLSVRIRLGEWLSFMNVECCQAEVSATGRSLVQRSPTACVCVCVCVCVCERERERERETETDRQTDQIQQ